MDRRRFIAAAGMVLGAGCSNALPSGSEPTPTPTATETATPTPRPTPRVRRAPEPGFTPSDDPYAADYGRSGGFALDRGEFTAFSFRVDSPVTLRYAFDVVEGGPVDVLVMQRDAFGAYERDGERIRFYDGASARAADRAEVTTRLPAGEHVVVFDNTHLGDTSPRGPVRLRFGLSLGTPSTPTPVPTATPFPFREASTPAITPAENPYVEGYARSGGLALGRGRFRAFTVQNADVFTLRYGFSVLEGGGVDVMVMSESAFETFLADEAAGFYEGASATGSTGAERSVRLPGGSHALVFDNTHQGPTSPRGPVRLAYGFGFGSGGSS